MAKKIDISSIPYFNSIKENILNHKFSPIYIISGEEPYYIDILSALITENALKEEEKDFNFTLLYGTDTNAQEIISLCSRYPMMAERQLIMIKEAQNIKNIEGLEPYLEHIVDTTILVLCLSGKNLDKRTNFYKKISSKAVMFESLALKQENVAQWIEANIKSLGKTIEPSAALLMAEATGTELRKISLETEKLIKAIPLDQESITTIDIENNVGISRTFNIIEMTNALAQKNRERAFTIAYRLYGSSNKNVLIKDLGYVFYFFAKVEEVHAAALTNKQSIYDAATSIRLFGAYGKPFIDAAKNYSLRKTMAIISYIKDCDYRSKSNFRGNASDYELLIDLLGRIIG